jgi:transglutaminase-like putative cysteine protease
MIPGAAVGTFRWWVLRIHWLLGVSLLAVYTKTSPAALLFTSAAWAAGAWMDLSGTPRESLSRFGSVIVGALLAVSTADLFLTGRDLLSSASFLLLGIQSVKLLLPKRTRDGWQLCSLSLLEFLVAASIADDLSFALYALLFLASSAGAMWSLHDQESEELGRPAGGYVLSRRAAACAFLLVALGGVLATAALFAVVPRLEFRRGVHRFGSADALPGFSDRITLREITGIKSDRRVVARIEFPFLERIPDPGALYLRGAVYSRYADDEWRLAETPASYVPRAGFHYLLRDAPRGPVTAADIMLEPADHPRIFTCAGAVRIEGNIGPLLADAEENLLLPQPGHPTLRYRLLFAEEPPQRGKRGGGPEPRHLEFPGDREDIRALGTGIAGDAATAAERAARLLGFFRTGFRYSLSRPASTLDGFLFREKAGYCEHYAAGLALLLRACGIPSRVAVGYLGGEWNDLGRYLIVRQSDAHAWVEAWIDGRWVTMDATPPQGRDSPFFRKTGWFGMYADWLRQRWDKYVMNYSLRMQADAVSSGWSTIRKARGGTGFPGEGAEGRKIAAAALLIPASALALYALLRKRPRKRGPGASSRLPAPYGRLLRRLERSGFRSFPGLPLEEMLAAAVRTRPDLSEDADRFLSLYHRDRFGPAPLPPDQRAEAVRRADRLRKALSGREAPLPMRGTADPPAARRLL